MEADALQVPNAGRAKQIFTSLLVASMTLHGGMIQGWQSPMGLKLEKDDSPVEKMSEDEIANLATIPGYFGLVTAFVVGFLAQKFGRKIAMYAIGIVSAVGGAILTFAPTTIYLYVGRTLSSAAGGTVSLAPMFISETVHESIRGTMMAICTFQLNLGILVAYTAGAKLSYKLFNGIMTVVPIVYTILLFFVPETPFFLAEKSRMDAAKESMEWFRGGDRHIAGLELERIAASKSNQTGDNMSFCEIVKSKVTRLALIISVGGFVLMGFSGIFAILSYAGKIFEESGSAMSPENSSIVIASILLGSSVVNVMTMDKLGRKPLLYFSFIGNAIGMTVLAVYLYLKMKGDVGNVGWIPISSVGLFAFTYGVGLAAVPSAIVNEVSPTNIRPTVGVVVMVFAFLIVNLVVQTFPYMKNNIGMYSVFVIPAVANFLGVIFTFFVVPETKGKSLVEIEEELKNR